jgi:hypothetical protein
MHSLQRPDTTCLKVHVKDPRPDSILMLYHFVPLLCDIYSEAFSTNTKTWTENSLDERNIASHLSPFSD